MNRLVGIRKAAQQITKAARSFEWHGRMQFADDTELPVLFETLNEYSAASKKKADAAKRASKSK